MSQSTGVPLNQSAFSYDGLNRKRITREKTWINNAWRQDSELRYVYDGLDVIQERDGLNVVQASYTRAGGTGGLLAKTTIEGGSPVYLFYHYDGGGNVSQLTDATGAVVARYAYDA